MIEFLEGVMKKINEGRAVDVVYKAFDKVTHGRLVQKLRSHGIRGGLARWIQNWIGYRRQRIAVEGCFSEWKSRGVPQRSMLGRLLFGVYINDLEENVGGLISTFADDMKIGGVADSAGDCQRIQWDIDRWETWAQKWQM